MYTVSFTSQVLRGMNRTLNRAHIKNDSGKVLRAKGTVTPYQVRDYITYLRLADEGEDLGQSPLYGHTFVGLEGEVDREEDREASCQGANVEHHVQEEEG